MSREIFVYLLDGLLYQKVARLLNEQVMFVFTTQVVKRIQKGPKGQIWTKRDKYIQKSSKGSNMVKYGQKGINISKRGQKGSAGKGQF